MSMTDAPRTVRSDVPARIDRLPWSRFHWLVVVALGVAWILDGIEVQMAASISSVLQDKATLHLSTSAVTWTVSIYLLGEVVGALWFGRLSDKLGRRKLFLITLGIYLVANGLAGFSWNIWSFLILRFIAGMGIGGEYAAINSAIDELIPAKYRGRVDIAINGTYWAGAALAAAAQLVLLNPDVLPKDIGWRICLSSARSSAYRICACAGTYRRARGGCSPTGGPRRPNGSSRRSRPACRTSSWKSLATSTRSRCARPTRSPIARSPG